MPRILSCLMEHLYTEKMVEDCEHRLLELQYFISRDWKWVFCFVWFGGFFGHAACEILVPWPGIEPVPPALEAQSLKHWKWVFWSHSKVSLSLFYYVVTIPCILKK